MTNGMPSKGEYASGEQIPQLHDQRGALVNQTWRCLQCGATWDVRVTGGGMTFPSCQKEFRATRWAFVEAKPY